MLPAHRISALGSRSLQARDILRKEGEGSQLIKGPFISLSRSFEERSSLREPADEGVLHSALAGVAEHPRMSAHKQAVFEAGQTVLF